MPTLPRQSVGVAYRPETYASHAEPIPARRIATPRHTPQERPQTLPVLRPRQRVQNGWLLALVLVALLVVSAGMIYLSGHAQVTQEGYRRTKLLDAVKRERETRKQWQQRRGVLYTAAYVEKKARALGMVPGVEKQVVTVGETTPEQLLPQEVSDQATGSRQ